MFKHFLTTVQQYRVAILYRRYRAMAQLRANQLNCKVYCIKVGSRPRLLTRADIQHLKAKRILPRSFTALDLQRIALFYVLPNNNNA